MEPYSTLSTVQNLTKLPSGLFTLHDFRRLFPTENTYTVYERMKQLKRKTIVAVLSKGKYMLSANAPPEFAVANFLYQPSYVSLESALSFYSIITGFPHQVFSLTTHKTKHISALGMEYRYVHIKSELFWGFEKRETFLIADKEKALLDYLYLASKGLRLYQPDEFDFSDIDRKKLITYCRRVKDTRLERYMEKQL